MILPARQNRNSELLILSLLDSAETLGGCNDGVFSRTRRPVQHAPGFFAGGFFLSPNSGMICFTAGSRNAARRTRKFGISLVGTFLAAAPICDFSSRAISSIDIKL